VRTFVARKKLSLAIAGVVVLGASAAVALANPGNVFFAPSTLVTGTNINKVEVNSDRVKFQTKGETDVRVQKIVFSAGGLSGWHHHPGFVIATVASGSVTFTHADCTATTYGPGLPAGSVFTESGDNAGQASSATGAVLYATFIAPHVDGPPVFRIEDDPVTCP